MKSLIAAIAITLVLAGSAFAESSAWDYSTKTGIDGKVTETAISGWGHVTLVVRCSKTCEVYFTPKAYSIVASQDSVRVKFNDKSIHNYGVSRSEDDTALFFRDPTGILKAIRDNGGYMTIEYEPYEEVAETVKYDVWNLPSTILARLAKQENHSKETHHKQTTPTSTTASLPTAPSAGSYQSESCPRVAVSGYKCNGSWAVPLTPEELAAEKKDHCRKDYAAHPWFVTRLDATGAAVDAHAIDVDIACKEPK
jgi:hypothetical protein